MTHGNSWHTSVYRVDASSDDGLPGINTMVTTNRGRANKAAARRRRMGYDVYVRIAFVHWYDTRTAGDFWYCDGSCGRDPARERAVDLTGPVRLAKRPPIPVALRRAVYERDGFACVECGSPDDLSIDHVIPFGLDGDETMVNLQTLCRSCNSSKGARPAPS